MKAANIFVTHAALLLLLLSSFASQGRSSVFISSVQFQGHPNAIAVNFSEAVEAASALLTSNYSLSNATGTVTISSAYFYTNGTTRVIVTTSQPLTLNVAYRLNAANVRNAAATQTITNTSLTVNVGNVALGVVERRFFGNISGVLPSDLTSSASFINNQPDVVDYPAGIDQNSNIGDNYGQQFRGYFIAPRNGTNIFYVSSDDGSELHLSTDANPANKVLIAREEQWNNGRDWLGTTRRTVNPATGVLWNRSGPNTVITVANQKYYLEYLHKEGTGGDSATVTVQLPGDPAPTVNSPSTMAQYMVPFGTLTPVTLTIQPTNASRAENGTITLAAAATGLPTPQFKWQRNGADIPNGTNSSYTIPSLTLGDNGAQFRVIAYNSFSSASSSNATLTVIPDTFRPTLVNAASGPTLTNVTVTFSERVTQATAQNLANYQIAGLTLFSATLLPDLATVILRTSRQTEGQSYSLIVNNIQDRASTPNTIAANSTIGFTAWVFCPGVIKVELFMGISGNAVADLTSSPKYIANTPDVVFYTNIFAFNQTLPSLPVDQNLDNYGSRVSAWFVAPSNGNYRFFIRSDDLSQLSMNTNAVDATDPAGKVIIAQQNITCCKSYGDTSGGPNVSSNINLSAGHKYYMEALHKEGGGADGFTMAWREAGVAGIPSNSEAAAAVNFASVGNPDSSATPSVTITQQPVNASALENRSATFTVAATNSANIPQVYQWQKNGVDISGATSASYTTPPLLLADSGSLYRARACVPGRAVYSAAASVNVLPDTVPPSAVAGFGDPVPNHLRIVFDEVVAAADANNPVNYYYFSGGQQITSATLLADGKTVLLTVPDNIQPGQYYLQAINIRDIASNGGNVTPQTTTPSFTAPWVCANGFVLRELYFNNSGPNNFQTMSNNPAFPNYPGASDFLSAFNSPQRSPNLDNFTTRITGYLIPTFSGNYNFQLGSDDSGWLMISLDASAQNKQTIIRAEGDCGGCGSPQAGPVTLTAGNAYYVEALMQEGFGGDYLTISWQSPDGGAYTVISSANLAYCSNPDTVTLEITTQPTNITVLERRTAKFVSAAAGTGGPIAYQWQASTPPDGLWADIPGATNSNYSITQASSAQSGGMFRVIVSLSGGLISRYVTSDSATLSVLQDITPPAPVAASSLSGTTIKLTFDEDVLYSPATGFSAYHVTGANVVAADLRANNSGLSNTVLLTLDQQLPASTFIVSGVATDGGGNAGPFSIGGKVFALGSGLIDDGPVGTPDDPVEKGSAAVGVNRLEVVAGGHDIWDSADGFQYAWGIYSGDFDLKVRVSRLDPRDRWSKAGLMVREDLSASSRNLNVVVDPAAVPALDGSGTGANTYEANMRLTTGSASSSWAQFNPSPVPYSNAWIRLQRLGFVFNAYWGTNGVDWFQFATTTQDYPQTVYVGLCTTAHDNSAGQTTTAVYEKYGIFRPPQTGTSSIQVNGSAVSGSLVVTNSALVEILSTFPNGVIFYTLDGAYPGTGPFYAGPFLLGQSATVRALAYASDFSSSAESGPVSVTVVSTPLILQQPHNQDRLVGQTASFSVDATGSSPLTYQWYHNGIPVPGANGTSLTISNVQPSDAGEFQAVIQNAYGSVPTVSALLNVYQLPSIVTQSGSTNVPPGNPVTFTALAGGTPPLHYQWRRNGVNIQGQTNSSLTIPHVQVGDGGSYTVIVGNDFGTVITDPAHLLVAIPPVEPADNFADAVRITGASGIVSGANTFATKEPGEPNHGGKPGGRSVWYKWQAPATGIATVGTRGSTFDTLLGVYTGTNVATLTTIASDEDSGGALTSEVHFNVTNRVDYAIAIDGFGASDGYFLLSWSLETTAQSVPVILQQPRSVAVLPGSNVVFSVTATGGSLNYAWLFDDVPIDAPNSPTLQVPNAQIANIGFYSVRISNSFGRVVTSDPASLELVSQPSSPTQDKLADADAFSPTNQLPFFGKGQAGLTPISLGVVGYQFFQNLHSSSDPVDPADCAIGGASRWLKVVASTAGTVSFDTITSQVATVIAVYRGGEVSDITPGNLIKCDVNGAPDGHSLVRFVADPGVTNSILIDGVNGAAGSIYLHYAMGTPPAVVASLGGQLVKEGSTLALAPSVSAGIPPPTYYWYQNSGHVGTGATPLYISNNVPSTAGGTYSLVASNILGMSSNVVAKVTIEVPLHLDFLALKIADTLEFHILGSASQAFFVEGTTNFLDWIPLYTNKTPFVPIDFIDPAAATEPLRFYRAQHWQP